jgi:hypothetical protein
MQVAKTLTPEQVTAFSDKCIGDQLAQHKIGEDPSRPETEQIGRLRRLVLFLERSSGHLRPRVEVLHPQAHTIEDREAADSYNTALKTTRQPPPEIRLADGVVPTEDDTIDLFSLGIKQAMAFRIIVRTLLAEKNKEVIPQLKMVISGQAGTGKSEVMKAVIWFAFQHDMSRLIGTSAYNWKAAVLVRTANCPAVSSCCFFGINTMRKNRNNPGHGDKCNQYFNSDVRLLWLEEGGTASLEFLVVSAQPMTSLIIIDGLYSIFTHTFCST